MKKLESSNKKDDRESENIESETLNQNTKSPSESKSKSYSRSHSQSHSRSRSRSHSASKSKSKSESKSKSKSKSSKNSRKSSEEKYPKSKKQQRESKEKLLGDDEKKGPMPNFPNFMNPQPFNPKHFAMGQMQGGIFPPHYGGPFMPMGPLHFPNFFRPQPPLYYKPGYNKKFAVEDNDKNAPNLLQNLGVGVGLKPMRFDKRGSGSLKSKKKSDDAPTKTKKTIEDVLVFKKFNCLPLPTEIFLTVQGFLQFADQNLYMNMSKKLLADFEKKCKDSKMKNLAKSLGRYLINFNEMIKKEKEKEQKDNKETKKKPKDGKSNPGDEKEQDFLNKVKDFETVQWLHENKNVQDLFNKVSLEGFKLDEFNINPLEKCLESKTIFEEAKELFLQKFKGEN